ncbi:transmembrane protease serine 11F-like [Macrobrachium nipponense]|uniref:transmembrane protease serine 11F-like n=1 Tax=Macrobrachium nipponense TaxID=159736 RepID=UPI0030C840A5
MGRLTLFLCFLTTAIIADDQLEADSAATPQSRLLLNPFSILGNPPCEYNGADGVCYGEVECLALAGSYGNFCPGLQGLCCLFYRTCGQRTSQEVSYFRNVQFPLEEATPEDCAFQVIKRSEEYCGMRVSMEKADLPAKSGGSCDDVHFRVKGIHNDRLKPKCGRLTGKKYSYDMKHVNEVSVHITSQRSTSVSWNLRVEQVKCSQWEGEDHEEEEGVEVGGGGGGGVGVGGGGGGIFSTTSKPVYPPTFPPVIGPPAPPTSSPITGGGGGGGGGGGSGGGAGFAKCGVKGPPFNQGTRESVRLVSYKEPIGPEPEVMARRRKTPSSRRRPVDREHVNNKGNKQQPQIRPVHLPHVKGSIASGAAVTSIDWDVPSLNDTLFAHYAGKPSLLSTRITFGNVAGLREFPWQIAMTVNGKFHCGASLISDSHVLTAAHCVVSYQYSPSQIDLSLGDWDLTTTSEGKSIKAKVSKVSVHPRYSRSTLQNDLAVLKLTEKVEYTDRIRPICLPTTDINVEDQLAIVSGWGRNEVAKLQSQLHYVQATVIKNSVCDQRWNSNGAARGFIVSSMMCMDSSSGDSCNGDSGGPSIHEQPPGSGNYVQVGIVSFGSGTCTDASLPGVYTRVSYYRDWIQQQMT